MTLIYSQWMAIAVLAVVIFLFDNLRKERSGPLIKQSVVHVVKTLGAHWWTITALEH